MNKRNVFIVLVSALVIMICVTYQGTYSYFTAAVGGTGNTENNTSTGGTATLSDLILTNGDNIANTTMIPGDSVTITFTVENPNTIQVCFNLLWSNTENTFVNQKDLVYTLEDEDGTMLVSETQYPGTNTGTTMLLEGTSIGASETKTYTLTITYKETDEDQTADIGKAFSGSIIGELGECYVPPSFNEELLACEDTAANCIKNNASLTNELVDDETADHNIRYIGANPNNYVSFNNELWRIIGVMNNIDDGTGNKETRLKIIRDEPYSEGMRWNTDGVNDWSTASLQDELNGTYLENITSPSKEMIKDAVWKLGGLSGSSSDASYYVNAIASTWYTYERGTTIYEGRPTEWTGKIGLMYPSDYGYATSGGSTTNRETCLNTALNAWVSSSVSDCFNNDWLYKSGTYQWTLTSTSSNSLLVFDVGSFGGVGNDVAGYAGSTAIAVSPALYLTSNVKISGGEGTEESPYQLSL